MSPPTVHLVDDDASFGLALSRHLRASGFNVATFPTATDFLERLKPTATGCVIADLQMPNMNGLELQVALARTHNPMPVLFLTGHGDIPSSVRAMRLGAEDFLEKTVPSETLLETVRRALARDARERADRLRRREYTVRLERLSDREQEVLRHVVRGQMNKQIADDLGISERTVKLHRTSITTKLGLPSVAELTRFAQEAGLLP